MLGAQQSVFLNCVFVMLSFNWIAPRNSHTHTRKQFVFASDNSISRKSVLTVYFFERTAIESEIVILCGEDQIHKYEWFGIIWGWQWRRFTQYVFIEIDFVYMHIIVAMLIRWRGVCVNRINASWDVTCCPKIKFGTSLAILFFVWIFFLVGSVLRLTTVNGTHRMGAIV